MLYPGFLCHVRQTLALLYLTFRTDFPEVLDTVDAVHTVSSMLQGFQVFEISLRQFDALACQVQGRITARVASQCSQVPSFCQHMVDDGPALLPCCSCDEHCFVCIEHDPVSRFS
jgi:hypothetical protein